MDWPEELLEIFDDPLLADVRPKPKAPTPDDRLAQKLLEINKNGYRFAWYLPASYTTMDAGSRSSLLPCWQQFHIFDKIKVGVCALQVWSNKYEPVFQFLSQGLGSRGQNCVNSAYFVANLPTCFKNITGSCEFGCHKILKKSGAKVCLFYWLTKPCPYFTSV